MKKILLPLLVLAMTLSLCACGDYSSIDDVATAEPAAESSSNKTENTESNVDDISYLEETETRAEYVEPGELKEITDTEPVASEEQEEATDVSETSAQVLENPEEANEGDGSYSDESVQTTLESSDEARSPEVTIPEPEYEGNLVWIPVNGGTKYHSKSSCSNMEDPIQVTLETAEANGFTPCKRCH